MERRMFVLGAAGAAFAPRIAGARTLGARDAIARLFTTPTIAPAWFSASFLAAVPIEKMRSILADVIATLGGYESVAPNRSRFTVTFVRGTIQADALIDKTGAFTGLLFSRMQSPAIADRLAALFQTGAVPPTWFSDSFLAAVPLVTIRAGITSMKAQYGRFVSTTPSQDGSYDVEFTNGSASALAFLGPDGKVVGLIWQPH